MVSSFCSVLSTLGPHFYVFPACSASPKGIFETFLSLLKPSVYPSSCPLSANDFEFLLTEKRDSLVLSGSAPSFTLNLPPFIACAPACHPSSHPAWVPFSHDFCDNVHSWLFHFSGHSFPFCFCFQSQRVLILLLNYWLPGDLLSAWSWSYLPLLKTSGWQEQAKLIHSDRSQNSGSLWAGEIGIDCRRAWGSFPGCWKYFVSLYEWWSSPDLQTLDSLLS